MKNNCKRFTFLLLLMLSFVLLFGCNKETAEQGQQEQQEQQKQQEQSNEVEKEEEVEVRKIIDHAGREVILPEEINRVVSTHRPLSFFVFAIGGQDKIVGADTHSTKSEFLQGFHPDIAAAPAVGTKKDGLNMEEIIKAQPDVVLLQLSKDNEPILQQLETQGITTVVLNPETVENMKDTAKILGEVFGTQEQATRIIEYYENTEKLIADRLVDIKEEDRKRVYMTGSEVMKVVTPDIYQDYIIQAAGGINVAAEMEGFFPIVSSEQIVLWNPDVMVALSNCESGVEEMLSDSPQLQSTNALKNKELYRLPSEAINWEYPEPVSSLAMLWLAKHLYPEQFEDINIEEETNKFFKEFYGKTFTEVGGVITYSWE